MIFTSVRVQDFYVQYTFPSGLISPFGMFLLSPSYFKNMHQLSNQSFYFASIYQFAKNYFLELILCNFFHFFLLRKNYFCFLQVQIFPCGCDVFCFHFVFSYFTNLHYLDFSLVMKVLTPKPNFVIFLKSLLEDIETCHLHF